jgi:hypothetical protein
VTLREWLNRPRAFFESGWMFFSIIAGSALVALLGEYIPRPVATVLEGVLGVAWALFLLCMTVGGLYMIFGGLRNWRPRWDPGMARIWFKLGTGFLAIVAVGLLLDPWVPHEWSGPVLIGGTMLYLLTREMKFECNWGWGTAIAWAAAFASLWGALGHPLAIFLLGLFAACLLVVLSAGLRAFGRWLLNVVRSF